MDGKWLLRQLRGLLGEDADSDFLSNFDSYGYLYDAAVTFTGATRCLKGEQSITTIADQSSYTLDAEFIELYLKNVDNRLYITYNDGDSNTFLTFKDYEDIVYSDNTDSVPVPSRFTIQDVVDLSSRISRSTTSNGTSSGGECVLTDSGGSFSTTVSIGDIVHNTTDGSDGIVLSVDSDTELTTALFDGVDDDWTSGDSYVIQPQGRFRIILEPPPATSGHTITIYYIQRPVPVFSDYGIYRFPNQYGGALIKYAAWLYKYKDLEPNTGDAFFQYWTLMLKQAKSQLDKTLRRSKFSVNLKRRKR